MISQRRVTQMLTTPGSPESRSSGANRTIQIIELYYAVVLPESSSRCEPTTSAMRMSIHLSAVCEISQDLRYFSPASSRRLIGYHSISARDEHAESSATACEIADEVRSNLFFGLDV
jgi:hypothetical protein